MFFNAPLRRGALVRRYKRFLADILFEDGSEATAHCPNPGSMLGVAPPGAPVWVSRAAPGRKLDWRWELVRIGRGLVAINTQNPNRIAAEAIAAGRIPELTGYADLRREVRYGENSRIDLLLEGGRRREPAFVEIKNVHLMRNEGTAEFPDCVTARGAKHLRELGAMRAGGARAVMLFIVQRTDCRRFRPAADLDPAYATALQTAADAGVELLCYDCEITTEEVTLRRPLPIEL